MVKTYIKQCSSRFFFIFLSLVFFGVAMNMSVRKSPEKIQDIKTLDTPNVNISKSCFRMVALSVSKQ